MKVEIVIPQMGANIAEGRIVRSLKKHGEKDRHLEPIFELETSKATFEIEAESAGTLAEILHESGTFPPLTVVGYLEAD